MTESMPKICLKIALVSIIFFTPFSTLSAFSRDGEELKILDDLIATSERQIAIQKELRALIVQFHTQQDLFFEGSDDDQKTKQIASDMAETGTAIKKMAETHHYLHLLPSYFLQGLECCANIVKKNTPSAHPGALSDSSTPAAQEKTAHP